MNEDHHAPAYWRLPTGQSLRREAHFDSRLVRCFASRPSGIASLLREAADRHPQLEALVDGAQRWTWAQLKTASTRIATGLRRLGVMRGDRVALLMGNRAEFVLAFYAIAQCGAVAVPVSPRDSAKGIAFILNQCAARAVIAQSDLAHLLPGQLGDGSALLQVLCSGADGLAAPRTGYFTRWDALTDGTTEANDGVEESDEVEQTPAIILYTSGTTGQPKGAVITHFNVVHSALHYQTCLGLETGERALLAVPGSHVTGMIAIIATMGTVAGCVIILREFKAAAFLQLAAREHMSYTLMVPAMYALCLREPGMASCDLSAWRLGGFGGAPMPVSTIEQLAQHCPGIRLFNAYGATETTSPAAITPTGSPVLDAVGVTLPCADILIMDDAGREVLAGESGEVWIGGPMVVPGYWNNPQATAASFCGGYWKSGDIGAMDSAGFLRIHDRKKDMINRGGYKVFSVEVENCLMAHPGVLEAAAVGLACPVLGERVHAFVYLGAGASPGAALAEQLRDWCRRDLADYKVPETITFAPLPLPRNVNGKLLKRELRERLSRTG